MKIVSRVLAVAIILSLTACAPLVRLTQGQQGNFLEVSSTLSLGQTFTATYNGLAGVDLYLMPFEKSSGVLLAELRDPSRDGEVLGTSQLPADEISQPGYYRFSFAPQPGSQNHDYYLEVSILEASQVKAGIGSGSSYLQGAAYQNGTPLDAQLRFRLAYDTWQAATGLLREALSWLGLLLAAGWLFLTPGWALSRWLYPGWEKLPWSSRIGVGLAVGLAVYPAFFVWCNLLNLQPGNWTVFLLPGFALVSILIANRAALNPRTFTHQVIRRLDKKKISFFLKGGLFPFLTLFLLTGLLIFTRFWPVRSLFVPMWGDSLQHTMITQLLVDHGGLFTDWTPYAELKSFTYHFGFHASAAAIHWLTRLPVPQATLYTGQILNIFAVLTLIPLAKRLVPSHWTAPLVVLIAGILVPMPQFYANWGRFTQLAGQVILPVVAFLIWTSLESKQYSWRGGLLIALILAGLALTHYRVVIFGLVVYPAVFVAIGLWHSWRVSLANLAYQGITSLVIFLPWLPNLANGRLVSTVSRQVTRPASSTTEYAQIVNAIGNPLTYLPAIIWIIFTIAAGWGLIRRHPGAIIVLLWWVVNLLAANPQWLGLPGVGTISSFTVMIALYIPASILITWVIGDLLLLRLDQRIDRTQKKSAVLGSLLLSIAILGSAAWGARLRIREIQPSKFALFTRPDMRAMQWIGSHVPNNATFLVNAFTAFGGYTVVGSDGGWWLPYFTQRASTLPPINYFFDQGPLPDYLDWVRALPVKIASQGITDTDIIAELSRRKVTHVYIGQLGGTVNSPGPLIAVDVLLSDSHFLPIYHQDRVWIFEFKP